MSSLTLQNSVGMRVAVCGLVVLIQEAFSRARALSTFISLYLEICVVSKLNWSKICTDDTVNLSKTILQPDNITIFCIAKRANCLWTTFP